jgi:carbohydrate-binding DOMON domain-containing protein
VLLASIQAENSQQVVGEATCAVNPSIGQHDMLISGGNDAVKQLENDALTSEGVEHVTRSTSSELLSESTVASRVQAITAAIAYAQQQTQPFACTVADVSTCTDLAGQHTMIVALCDSSTVTNMFRQVSPVTHYRSHQVLGWAVILGLALDCSS